MLQEKPLGGVYMIINTVTEDIYVGSTKDFEDRRKRHFTSIEKEMHHNPYLMNAAKKYGKDAFEMEILEVIEFLEEYTIDEYKVLLLEREQIWMDALQPKYNIRKIASSNLGIKYSDETIKRMSNAAKNRQKPNQEIIERATRKIRNRVQSQEERTKRSKTLMGHDVSLASREKMRETNKKTWAAKSKDEKHRIATNRVNVNSEEVRTKRRIAQQRRRAILKQQQNEFTE